MMESDRGTVEQNWSYIQPAIAFFDDVAYQAAYYTALIDAVREDVIDVVVDRHGELGLSGNERAHRMSQDAKLERIGL